MKKIILLFITFLVAIPILAQNEQKFSSDDLNGLKMEFASNETKVYNREAKKHETDQVDVFYYWNHKYQYVDIYRNGVKILNTVSSYYLSDTKDEFFDYSKVGKSSYGTYIITAMYDEKEGSRRINTITEIVKLSEDEMIINTQGAKGKVCKILEREKK